MQLHSERSNGFSDIIDFSHLSEVLSPSEVVKQYNGSVIQLVGDEIFANFIGPELYSDNEANAVYCAIKMMDSLPKLNQKYKDRFGTEIKIGIGINYGEAVAGNLGSEERIRYSVTGDFVNTGKRIESITMDFPNSILVYEVLRIK